MTDITVSAPETGGPPGPIASLPSGAPIPSSRGPASPSRPRPIPLGAVLAALPSHADAFLARLNKALSTPAGIDTVMLFLCYTSRFSASVLTGLSTSVLRRSAREWVALLLPSRTGATVIAAAGPATTATTAAASAALVLAARLRALSTLLSEARTILRLWALLGMYFWGKGLVAKALAAWRARSSSSSSSSTRDKVKAVAVASSSSSSSQDESAVATLLEWTRLACCVGLQALENGAYLSSRGVLGWTPAQQGRAYKWSARFWAAYVGIELGRLLAESTAPPSSPAKAADETAEWRKKVARNMAWMPLTLHWSTDAGLVSEPLVGLLASVPGIIQMRDLWASTK